VALYQIFEAFKEELVSKLGGSHCGVSDTATSFQADSKATEPTRSTANKAEIFCLQGFPLFHPVAPAPPLR
jgi:hypothetical protein